MERIRLAVLGASGSIGRQTLDVVRAHPDRFEIAALSVGSDRQALEKLCAEFTPVYAAMRDEKNATGLEPGLSGAKLVVGAQANALISEATEVDAVVIALPGMEAIFPLLAAAKAQKRIALANKECLVCGGDFVQRELAKVDAKIYPIDSEQSAIFQCLQGIGDQSRVSRLILTASGGPFREATKEEMDKATIEQALAHPNWKMGRKISIDSASLANKGLEVIEAHFLFGISWENIHVLIHPQSLVHSMVGTVDGAILAQLGSADMRLPIQYALTCPDRWNCPADRLDWEQLGSLTFLPPDNQRFPCLPLAYEALRLGGTATAVYNAADEIAVQAFLDGRIGFMQISGCLAAALDGVPPQTCDSLEEMLEADQMAREVVRTRIKLM